MRSSSYYIAGAVLLIVVALLALVRVVQGPDVAYVTTTVERGDVREVVSISGTIEADNTAELSFPVSGTVAEVRVTAGDVVAAGDILVTLERSDLLAERRDAEAALQIARADRAELIAGPTSEARDVTRTAVETAEQNLARVTSEQAEKVANARRALYSTSLEAISTNEGLTRVAPTITGTYQCEGSGEYRLEMYSSGAQSGWSYRISGLETGTANAVTTTPTPLGNCGLLVQFPSTGSFGNTTWVIAVPNQNSSSYVTNLNAYELALEQQENTVEAAAEALLSAEQAETLANAAPRAEALARANARVDQARARLAAVNAQLEDHLIRAPFAGTVTDVEVLPGEAVGTTAIVDLLSDESFDLTARIPEIDISRMAVGQKAVIIFDAEAATALDASVVFISPVAIEIDGVAYFEAKLTFTDPPTWLRSGLNADVDVIVREATDVPQLPQRFITTTDNVATVLVPTNGGVTEQTVEVGLVGNDGFSEVVDLPVGTTVVAP
jgi:HlyD family secretion protein